MLLCPSRVHIFSRGKKKVSLIWQDSDVVMVTSLHRHVHSMQILYLPWVVKAFAISVKTGFISFGKVDLPFHAPVSQQSVKTRRHSSTGLEFLRSPRKRLHPPKSNPFPVRFSYFVPHVSMLTACIFSLSYSVLSMYPIEQFVSIKFTIFQSLKGFDRSCQ